MGNRRMGPLQTLQRLAEAGDLRITKVGQGWLAWTEPSVHITGTGDSPDAAVRALVGRLHVEVPEA